MTSVAEDEVMRILVLIRNYIPARDQIINNEWDVPAVAVNSWDLIDKTVGTVGGGKIGFHMMKRLRVRLLLSHVTISGLDTLPGAFCTVRAVLHL